MKNRQQFLGIIAGAILALWIGDKLLFTPMTAAWKARSERIAQLRKNIAQGELLAQRAQPIRTRWERMQTNALPNNVSEAETKVLRAFDRWSQEARISVSALKPQWKRAADDYTTLEYRCDAFGSMESLTRFLYNIEKDPMALKIESVEITARDNNGEQLSLAVQVSGLLLSPAEEEP